MHATAEQVRPEFKGTKKQKEVADKVFEVTRATARFFSPVSPINVSLSALASHLSETDGIDAKAIDAALAANDHIFTRGRTRGRR